MILVKLFRVLNNLRLTRISVKKLVPVLYLFQGLWMKMILHLVEGCQKFYFVFFLALSDNPKIIREWEKSQLKFQWYLWEHQRIERLVTGSFHDNKGIFFRLERCVGYTIKCARDWSP